MSFHHPPAAPTDCDDCSETPNLPRNVRLATGEFVWQEEDLRISGRGLDFVWTRTYRSRPEAGRRHWDHAYNLRAEVTRGGVRVWNGTGVSDLYRPGSNGTYMARGVFAEGRLSAANEFDIRFSSGGAWIFRPQDGSPAAGHIARIVDRNGNALRFVYDGTGRLEVVTDTLGRDIRLGYDRAGLLTTLTDFTGRRLSYRYAASADLESVAHPAVTGTPTGNDFPDGASVRYAYSPEHRLTGVTDRGGTPLLDIEYASAFDHERVTLLRWGRAENAVHFTYHPAEERSGVVLAIVNDANGNVRDLLFDSHDQCVRVREYTARADPAKPTTLTENRPSRPVRHEEPAFYETRFTYDNRDGLSTRIVHPDGSTVEKEFEIDVRSDASPIERGNLRSVKLTPGPRGGDQPELVRRFDYFPGFGCTCGQAFVVRETDPRGAATLTEYDDRGNAVSIIERDGSRAHLTYNAFGDVIARTYDGQEPGARRKDTFEYSATHGQLTSETVDSGGLSLTTVYQQDALGRLVRLRDPLGHEQRQVWNAWDLLVRRTLPAPAGIRPSTEDTRYDANRKPVESLVRESGHEVRATRSYDVLGRLRTVSRQAQAGRQVVTTYDYDENGNRVATRRGDSHVVRLAFDALDRPYRRSRGQRGRGYREVTFDYDSVANLVRVTRGAGPDRSATLTRYDGYGRLVEIELPNGTKIRLSHDPNGNVLRQVVRSPRRAEPLIEVSQTFDAMDRLIRRTTTGLSGDEPAVETWEFDSGSRLVRHIGVGGLERRVRYDAIDRPVEVKESSGRVTTYAYDANSNLLEEVTTLGGTNRQLRTRYVRDPRGRVLEVAGAQGMLRKYTYEGHDRPATMVLPGERRIDFGNDGLGRPTQVTWMDRTGSRLLQIRQAWDASSRIVARTDPNGNTTRYVHDAAGNVIGIQFADGTTDACVFDTRGNCVSWTNPNGTKVVNTYDLTDRLLRREITPGAGVAGDTTTESYQYDELGRLIRATNDRHTVEWSYDSMSRVVAQVQDDRTIRTTYDSRGRRTAIHYPSGYGVDFHYEGPDLRRISDSHGPAIELDAAGTTRYVRSRGPVISTAVWNEAGLPQRLVTLSGATTLDARKYTWDESGNVIGLEVRDARGERRISYAVDSLDRLRGSSASGRRVEYELDAAGNRTLVRVDGKEGRYSMDDRQDRTANRYTTTPVDRRTYDANGNLRTVTDARGNQRSMRYDYLDRMVEYRDEATGAVSRYSYDCLGRRLAKSVSEGDKRAEVTYAFYADAIIEEAAAGGGTRSVLRYGGSVYGTTTDHPQGDQWLVTDALGSVVAEFDNTGTVTRAYDYGDYGEVTVRDTSGAVAPVTQSVPPVLFGGYLFDAESGLYYVRTRYLEPSTGRFTTPDSAGLWEDGRNRGNAYAYAANNPVTFVDPSGQSVTRWYSCGGPWPGPRSIKVEYEGCSGSRRNALFVPVCRAFRASGQSMERVFSLWLNDFTGVAQPGASTTRGNVQKWFGGPDNATSQNSKAIIFATLEDVFEAMKSSDLDIDCEGGGGTCAEANAYVNWGGSDANLCNAFFSLGLSKQASILIHELTHAYNDTDDFFYYPNDGSNLPWNLGFETPILRENADCYEQFTLEFFLP